MPLFIPDDDTNDFALGEASTASASPIKSVNSPTKSAKLSTPATTPIKDSTPEAAAAKSTGGSPAQREGDGTKSDPGTWLRTILSIRVSNALRQHSDQLLPCKTDLEFPYSGCRRAMWASQIHLE